MEVKCPKCAFPVFIDDTGMVFQCENCGSVLTEEVGGEGFSVVSVVNEEDLVTTVKVPFDDPILEDYTKWQLLCAVSVLFGLIAGYYFFKYGIANIWPKNPFISTNYLFLGLQIAGLIISILMVGGGAFFLLRIGREVKRYEKSLLNSLK